MTLITSAVGICNLALGHLKIEPISAIAPPVTHNEIICAQYYDITRQAVLESLQPAFAIKRATVAADTATPAFGWDYQSGTMPSDFIGLIGLYNSVGNLLINTNNQYYSFEGNIILTDQAAPYYIQYIADIQDVSKYDYLFVMNFSYALAVAMSEAFKTSSTLLQVINAKWDEWNSKARTANYKHGGIIRVNESPYINSRRSPMVTGYNTRVL